MKSASPSSLSRLHISKISSSNRNAVRTTPIKRPLIIPLSASATVVTPNHHNTGFHTTAHNHHNNNSKHSKRLRSPKGSSPFIKRSNTLSWLQQLYRFLPRFERSTLLSSFVVYTVLLVILCSVAYTTVQEIILSSTAVSTNIIDKSQLTTSLIPSSNVSSGSTLSSFDAILHHVIPKSIYKPKSSNPIPVIYIGRSWWQSHQSNMLSDDDNNMVNQDVLLDALQRSAYTKVMTSYFYSTNNITHPMHLIYRQQYHDMHTLDYKQPVLYLVDWTALLRDCHILQRIVNHILHQSDFDNTKKLNTAGRISNQVYMLLLDASASSETIMCHDSAILEQLIPNSRHNIRLAKRSIVTHRRYNYTKQWIESGTYITNPITAMPNKSYDSSMSTPSHILHWSGYVSQSYVQLLDMAVNDFTVHQSKKRDWSQRRQQQRNSKQALNSHYRPIDVAHYWKAATNNNALPFIKNEYQYYCNRLRQTVQEQINTTRQVIVKQQYSNYIDNSIYNNQKPKQEEVRENARSHWVEFVGIDALVEFVKNDSSADGSDAISNSNSKSKDDHDVNDEMNASLTLSSVHVATLASSKIVVVTQADEYEDHDTRLLEALGSGAMVLCDRMIAAPSGLVHKTNIVFFESASKLDQYVQYYLDPENDMQRQEIARHGVEYALGRHRSWHVLEALLFGKALTRTDKYPLTDTGPKIRKSSVNNMNPVLIPL